MLIKSNVLAIVLAAVFTLTTPFAGPLLVSSSYGQSTPSEQSINLTPDMVDRFIESFPKVKALAEQLETEYDIPKSGSPAEGFGAFMGYQQAYAQMNALVRSYGFADFPQWVQVLSASVRAMTFSADDNGMDAKMAAAMAQIEQNPSLSSAQKEMMRQQMQQAGLALNANRPSPENQAAVAGRTEQLKALFENN